MGRFYDIKIEKGDFGRGFVMTVFDKETQTYLVPSGWVDSDVPRPFLSTTGIMNVAKFRDFVAGVLMAYNGELLEYEGQVTTSRVPTRLTQEFQEEAALARGEDDQST